MKLFRLVRGSKNKTLQLMYKAINRLIFAMESVETSSNLSTFGKVFIRNYGRIVIGSDVKITSSFLKNPIGPANFSSIVTEKKGRVFIGNGSGISNSFIYSQIGITIKENVLIGSGCKIFDTDFHSIDPTLRLSNNDVGKIKPVVIHDNVFIGTGSIILKGSSIGCNSIIGAHSVVSGSIPENEVWAGNPAKFIKKVQLNS